MRLAATPGSTVAIKRQIMFIESSDSIDGNPGRNFAASLFREMGDGLLTVDSDGTISAITAEAERSLKLSLGKNSASLEQLPEPLRVLIREVQANGKSSGKRQIILTAGEATPVEVNVLRASNEQPPKVMVALRYETVANAFEAHLRRLNRLASIGTVSVSMAHEIKNAFVAMRTFIELLLERHPDADLAGVVRRELSRVDSIVSHMLKYSAPAQPSLARVRLHELLDHSLRLVAHGMGGKRVSFQRDFAAAPDVLTGDDHQLEQAFVNLLFNAVEALPAEGSITLRTELVAADGTDVLREGDSEQKLRIQIVDTGVGIPPEKLDQIFEPFFTTKPSGTGLGLAVTRRIIAEHRGTIRVESTVNQGTRFTILLPAGSAVQS